MPWKETDAMDQRKKFILEAFDNRKSFTELCADFGICTKTGYKWKKRFMQGGMPALKEQSRRPLNAGRPLPEDVVLDIIRFKNMNTAWGSRKIYDLFLKNYPERKPPARSSIERVLRKSGFQTKKKRKRSHASQRIQNRFKPSKPNDLWTVDFKGWWYTHDKERVNPLTVRDEYSKFILSIKVVENADISSVKPEFERLFRRYGIPRCIRTDNGPPFANVFNALGLTKLSVWWMALGITLDRIDPGCPYQNGGHERMHLDMKRELEGKIFGDLHDHQIVFTEWREQFNHERPHQVLHGKYSAEVYHKSEIKYEPFAEDLIYPKGIKTRKVNDRGVLNFRGGRHFIGNPFAGYVLGACFKEDATPEVWVGSQLLGTLDIEAGLINFSSSPKLLKAS